MCGCGTWGHTQGLAVALAVLWEQLDWMVWEGFSNLNNSMILRGCGQQPLTVVAPTNGESAQECLNPFLALLQGHRHHMERDLLQNRSFIPYPCYLQRSIMEKIDCLLGAIGHDSLHRNNS